MLPGQKAGASQFFLVHFIDSSIFDPLPTVMALLVLISPKNGAPLAIIGVTSLTAMRMEAAGAVAAKHLGRAGQLAGGWND